MQAAETASRVEGLDFGERSIDTAEHQSRVIKLAFAVGDTPLLWLPFERSRADPVGTVGAIATFASRMPSKRKVEAIVQKVREAHGRYWGGLVPSSTPSQD